MSGAVNLRDHSFFCGGIIYGPIMHAKRIKWHINTIRM